jgi:hypothetical protein
MPPSQHAVVETATIEAHEATIRTLVHKRLPENVLVTGFRAASPERFICTSRMPTAHPFLTAQGRTPYRDILFYTEVGRQASLAVSHAFLGVDIDDVFIFERSTASVTDAIWHTAGPGPADDVVIEIQLREAIRRRNNALSRVVADYSISVGAERMFWGTGTWTVQSASLFKRLRKIAGRADSTEGADPSESDLPSYAAGTIAGTANAVISAPQFVERSSAVTVSLIVDRTHAYFFDHSCDHVPGMLLLEGCAQLVHAACAEGIAAPTAWTPAIVAYEVDFTQFVELDAPVTLTAQVREHPAPAPSRPLVFDVLIAQRGIVVGTARLSAACPA